MRWTARPRGSKTAQWMGYLEQQVRREERRPPVEGIRREQLRGCARDMPQKIAGSQRREQAQGPHAEGTRRLRAESGNPACAGTTASAGSRCHNNTPACSVRKQAARALSPQEQLREVRGCRNTRTGATQGQTECQGRAPKISSECRHTRPDPPLSGCRHSISVSLTGMGPQRAGNGVSQSIMRSQSCVKEESGEHLFPAQWHCQWRSLPVPVAAQAPTRSHGHSTDTVRPASGAGRWTPRRRLRGDSFGPSESPTVTFPGASSGESGSLSSRYYVAS